MSANNGGAAFPSPGVVLIGNDDAPYQQGAYEGMTLRDYFAAHCPISFDESENYNLNAEDAIVFYANVRYEYADAMLRARAK